MTVCTENVKRKIKKNKYKIISGALKSPFVFALSFGFAEKNRSVLQELLPQLLGSFACNSWYLMKGAPYNAFAQSFVINLAINFDSVQFPFEEYIRYISKNCRKPENESVTDRQDDIEDIKESDAGDTKKCCKETPCGVFTKELGLFIVGCIVATPLTLIYYRGLELEGALVFNFECISALLGTTARFLQLTAGVRNIEKNAKEILAHLKSNDVRWPEKVVTTSALVVSLASTGYLGWAAGEFDPKSVDGIFLDKLSALIGSNKCSASAAQVLSAVSYAFTFAPYMLKGMVFTCRQLKYYFCDNEGLYPQVQLAILLCAMANLRDIEAATGGSEDYFELINSIIATFFINTPSFLRLMYQFEKLGNSFFDSLKTLCCSRKANGSELSGKLVTTVGHSDLEENIDSAQSQSEKENPSACSCGSWLVTCFTTVAVPPMFVFSVIMRAGVTLAKGARNVCNNKLFFHGASGSSKGGDSSALRYSSLE